MTFPARTFPLPALPACPAAALGSGSRWRWINGETSSNWGTFQQSEWSNWDEKHDSTQPQISVETLAISRRWMVLDNSMSLHNHKPCPDMTISAWYLNQPHGWLLWLFSILPSCNQTYFEKSTKIRSMLFPLKPPLVGISHCHIWLLMGFPHQASHY